MKVLKTNFLFILFQVIIHIVLNNVLFSQCFPTIFIDGNELVVSESDVYGTKLPYWLKPSQTLAKGYGVNSISVIEFTVNGTSLDFVQVLSITSTTTSPASVPAGKVWKIESVSKDLNALTALSFTFTTSGTFVPPCNGYYKIQVWGGGGGGCSGCYTSGVGYTGGGAGGGGGGYAEGVYYLNRNFTYSITVGTGGLGGVAPISSGCNAGQSGGSSSVTLGNLIPIISASGGGGGNANAGGSGGTGNGQINVNGSNGSNIFSSNSGSNGGNSGNTINTGGSGGSGTSTCTAGQNGTIPGGGAGGGGISSSYANKCNGGNGAPGMVIISTYIQ